MESAITRALFRWKRRDISLLLYLSLSLVPRPPPFKGSGNETNTVQEACSMLNRISATTNLVSPLTWYPPDVTSLSRDHTH